MGACVTSQHLPDSPCDSKENPLLTSSLPANVYPFPSSTISGPQLDGSDLSSFAFPAPQQQTIIDGPRRHGIDRAMMSRIINDFESAFLKLSNLPPAITVFGSARPKPGSPEYERAKEVGRQLALAGFTVLTGGGPGLMEATNRGAKEVGGHCVGLNITLPHEQAPNPYLDISHDFHYFFARKTMMTMYAKGFIGLPGGFGTLDELFEVLTLRQTGKSQDVPVALLGKDYWQPLIDFLREKTLEEGYICPVDFDRIFLTDSVEEAVAHVKNEAMEKFDLREYQVGGDRYEMRRAA